MVKNGGEKGIRTLDTIARIHAFQACAFNHSATSPIQTYFKKFLIDFFSFSKEKLLANFFL